ncbi:xyloglucan endotransglucosylase/hydrolase protein 2-like [Prosopis cineraria]|uniref:xyloglucan endotransglucosylase/hydrolase protein 2-like n=1 Tax=Prosopis cineraria TaxID=364024 RepID=UPI00240FD271|nr:xyloglucan endotransglucosylase/hydrolase protein 2-like [Prosopis cineraria]
MDFLLILVFLSFLVCGAVFGNGQNGETSFDENYKVIWGGDHVVYLKQGKEIQLSMDKASGSGFGSKMNYGSGFFHLKIKVPDRDSAGVVTAYYLTSGGDRHDEVDFEFLGNREGKPYTLQTNVFADGKGNREQRIRLWFDPTADFHDYKLLWNPHQLVFYVDEIPIRVYKNKSNIGVAYPSKAMKIEATLWDGESWATDGGKAKTNWSFAPFKAHFQGFHVNGCHLLPHDNDINDCGSHKYWWNHQQFWQLDSARQAAYQNVKTKYMTYDYCSDHQRYPVPPLECSYN